MRRLAAALLLLCAGTPALAERVWLVVGASDSSAAAIARKAALISARNPAGLTVNTGDCGDRLSMFAWVSTVASSEAAARAALARLREDVRDAYVKPCNVQAGSLLALRIPAVDSTIADVPIDAVNWNDADRVSSAFPQPDGGSVVAIRYFKPAVDDPLEGRRERVVWALPSGERVVLLDDCPSAGSFAAADGRIALQCAREQAGSNLLHQVLVFDASGRRIGLAERCREPRWMAAQELRCRRESVEPSGRLVLEWMPVSLSP